MKKEAAIKRSLSDRSYNLVLCILFGLFTIICIYPFYYLLINSISANNLSARGQIVLIPRGVHLENYKQLLQIPGLFHATLVSLFRTIVGTIGTVIGSAFLGYMFTQEDLLGRKFWYRFTVTTMYFSAGLIPGYLTMRNLGLTNNILAYVIPSIVSPFNIILVKTYVESTPKELQEAAMIDGADFIRIFCQIMLPLCKPILATVAIFSAVGQWNSFQDTLILMTEENCYTLQYLLYKYINQASSPGRPGHGLQGADQGLRGSRHYPGHHGLYG